MLWCVRTDGRFDIIVGACTNGVLLAAFLAVLTDFT